jgi:hypothetical protein
VTITNINALSAAVVVAAPEGKDTHGSLISCLSPVGKPETG